jgi:cytochrome c
MHLVPVGVVAIVAGLFVAVRFREVLQREGRNSLATLGVGGAGLALLIVGTYVLYGSVSRFFDPERWFLHYHAVRTLTAWSLIWRYLLFVAASYAMTGAAVLFFFRRPRGDAPIDGEAARFGKNLGAGLVIAGTAALPVFGFFYLVTVPVVAVSGALYGLLAAAVAVSFMLFACAYRAILNPAPSCGGGAFVLGLAVFSLMIVGDQVALVNATREHSAALVFEAGVREAEIDAKREAAAGAAAVADPIQGEKVFKTVCMTCHRMNERIVGPPLETVLPKYSGNAAGLEAFIRKPSKINADYPPMPVLGLPMGDVKSVAAYLLGQAAPADSTKTGP